MSKLTQESIAAVCAEIETGATVAEACRFVGVSKDAVYQAISRGAKATTGTAAQYRASIIRSQGVWERKARTMLLKAAAGGAPRAIDETLRRLERVSSEIASREAPPTDRVEFLWWRLDRVRRWIDEDTGIARTRLLDTEREIMREIEMSDPKEKPTPAELLALLLADLPSWSDEELLAAHAEGLHRGIPGFSPRG